MCPISEGSEFHCVGPENEKDRQPEGFFLCVTVRYFENSSTAKMSNVTPANDIIMMILVFVRGYFENSCVCRRVKLPSVMQANDILYDEFSCCVRVLF